MIKVLFVLHRNGEKKKSLAKYVKENANDINETVFRTLYAWGVKEETAIECASWAELAAIGESYNTDDLDVYIEDEE